MIVVVDYGMGNLRSVMHKLGKIGVEAVLSSNAEDVEKASRLILPGVGAFGAVDGPMTDRTGAHRPPRPRRRLRDRLPGPPARTARQLGLQSSRCRPLALCARVAARSIPEVAVYPIYAPVPFSYRYCLRGPRRLYCPTLTLSDCAQLGRRWPAA